MFVTVYALCELIDKRIGYLQDARQSDLYTLDYEKNMQQALLNNLEHLKSKSFNHKLIARYERKVNKVIKGVKI